MPKKGKQAPKVKVKPKAKAKSDIDMEIMPPKRRRSGRRSWGY